MMYSNYKITEIAEGLGTVSPDVNYFIKKIEDGESFSFLRANHAVFDSISPFVSLDFLNEKIKEKDYTSIAFEVYKGCINNPNSSFWRWHDIDENFVYYLSIFLKYFNSNLKNHNNLEFGISLDNGIFNFDNLDGSLTDTIQYLKQLYIKDKIYLNGGLIRHYSVTEEIFDFFKKLNEYNYDVILIGPPYLEMTKYVFNIKNFKIIPISYKRSTKYFDLRVDVVKNNIKKKETIILNSTGHLLSTYIYHKMRDLEVSQFDIGRGLDWNLNLAYKNNLYMEEFSKLSKDMFKPWIYTNENPWLDWNVELLLNNVNILRNG